MTADGGCEWDVIHGMNAGYRAWGALKSVLNKRRMGINAKKYLYEGVIIIIIIIIKKCCLWKAGRERLTSYHSD